MRNRMLVRLVFEGEWDDREADEARLRGYRSHVWAELGDGSRHRVTFYDLTRLTQTLDDESESGRQFFAEPGLIVVSSVTTKNMEDAARTLAAEGFFEGQTDR